MLYNYSEHMWHFSQIFWKLSIKGSLDVKRLYEAKAECLLKNFCDTVSYVLYWNKGVSRQKAHKNVLQQPLRDFSIQMTHTTKTGRSPQGWSVSITQWVVMNRTCAMYPLIKILKLSKIVCLPTWPHVRIIWEPNNAGPWGPGPEVLGH